MTFDYQELSDLAGDLLMEFGQSVTHRTFSSSSYSAGAVTNTPATSSRNGAVFDFGAGVTTIRGNLVVATDKRLLLDSTPAVSIGDQFDIGSDIYTVLSIGEVNPAGTRVLYDIHLRK